jgi:O-succinylbenzoic acid--CoA ligase
VINSGGAKIFPEQLEALVKKEIPNEVVFLGIDDVSLGQKLIAVIEGEKSDDLIKKIKKFSLKKVFTSRKKLFLLKKFENAQWKN